MELPLRLGSGDVMPKPNVARLDGDTVHFEDGTSDDFDVIIYATGYNITFPFFDPEFISAPDNHIRLYKRMFKPGIDDLVFIGFAQSVPTLFPFVECQSRLLAAYAVGRYALPPVDEMERVIDADQQMHAGHCTDRPRHTQQVDYFFYEHDIRTRELPAGIKRAAASPRQAAAMTPRRDHLRKRRCRLQRMAFRGTERGAPADAGGGDGARFRRHEGFRSRTVRRRFGAAGIDVLAFDYRGFGASEGATATNAFGHAARSTTITRRSIAAKLLRGSRPQPDRAVGGVVLGRTRAPGRRRTQRHRRGHRDDAADQRRRGQPRRCVVAEIARHDHVAALDADRRQEPARRRQGRGAHADAAGGPGR